MVNKLILTLGSLAIAAYFIVSSHQPSSNHKDTPFNAYFVNLAHQINSNPQSTWTASTEHFRYTQAQLKKMFNLKVEAKLPANFDEQPVIDIDVKDLPENFDPREKWPKCESFKEIRDQSACGSCWAFGAASAMSDRLCVKSDQKDQRRISSQDLVECCHDCGNGCDGGYLYESWAFFKIPGIVTGDLYGDKKSCKPYLFPPCNHHSAGPYEDCSKQHYDTPFCHSTCIKEYKKDYAADRIKAAYVYKINSEEAIMKELFTNGSAEAALDVYEDFLFYKKGVYQHTEGKMLGGHAIKIMGWGVEDGVEYWLCVNSWNENWGDKGTFKILRGSNHCNIELNVVGGIVA